jgi:hypothetical protein
MRSIHLVFDATYIDLGPNEDLAHLEGTTIILSLIKPLLASRLRSFHKSFALLRFEGRPRFDLSCQVRCFYLIPRTNG